MTDGFSVPNRAIVTDERIRNALQRLTGHAQLRAADLTLGQLANEAKVNPHNLEAIRTNDPAKQRRVAAEDMLSLAAVLGEDAVNALLAIIGYGGAKPLGEVQQASPMKALVCSMGHFATFAKAAEDDRIDHIERPHTTQAADCIIAEMLPFSSAGANA